MDDNSEIDYGVFTQDEFDTIITAAIEGTPEGCTDDELEKLFDYLTNTRVRNAILNNILSGEVTISIRENGEPKFVSKRAKFNSSLYRGAE